MDPQLKSIALASGIGALSGWLAKALHVRSQQLKPFGKKAEKIADTINRVEEQALPVLEAKAADRIQK